MKPTEKPGYIDGRHYTEYVEPVKALMRSGELERAESLLLRLVGAVEAQVLATGFGMAPWYTERLAVHYRKRKDFAAEVAILERYQTLVKRRFRADQGADYFDTRLAKAKLLRDRASAG